MSNQNTPVTSPNKVPVINKAPAKKTTNKKVAKKTDSPAKEKKVNAKQPEKDKTPTPTPTPTPTQVQEKTPAPAKTRTSLPAKYNKYIQFSFYIIRAINAKCLENNEDVLVDEAKFFEKAHVFDTADTQQRFIGEYLENKGIAKEMRAHVADTKKAAKEADKEAVKMAKAAEKEAVKIAKAAEKAATKAAKGTTTKTKTNTNTNTNTNTKTKTNTKKTTNKKGGGGAHDDEADLVTSLVTMAISNNQPIAAAASAPEEEPELDVRPFNHNGVHYLIDENNNLYDSNTHEMVGSFDVVNSDIIRV